MEYKIISKLVDIPLKELHIQYVPVVTPMSLWNDDMSLANSPHVELLRLIEGYGFNWDMIFKSRFARIRQHRALCGLTQWDKPKIKDHIKQRWGIYKSILKKGFKTKLCKDKPVIVLKKPFWNTRFGLKDDRIKGLEIWDGGRRSSASYALGHTRILGYYAEDSKPGSNDKGRFKDKLRKIEGIWN